MTTTGGGHFLFFTIFLLFITGCLGRRSLVKYSNMLSVAEVVTSNSKDFFNRTNSSLLKRKLPLATSADYGVDPQCTIGNFATLQRNITSESSKIPTYSVLIINTCKCSVDNIHIECGDFSSATYVDPKKFRKLSYDDCLLNGGKPLYKQDVSFEYTSTTKFDICIASVGNVVCS